MKRPDCAHPEGQDRKDGRRVDLHDCDYVDQRNKLADAAERHANRIHGVSAPVPGLWNREFFAEMDRLTNRVPVRP